MDLDLQEREADLVIATFGRSIYILDDIRPLRELANTGGETLNKPFAIFDPADAIIVNGTLANSGSHFPADAIFQGENKPTGAQLKVLVKIDKNTKKEKSKEKKKPTSDEIKSGKKGKADSLKITIYNNTDELIKTISQKPDSGLNIISWRFDEGELKMPTRGSTGRGRRGFGSRSRGNKTALPGTYKVVAAYKDQKDSTSLKVIFDPRNPKTEEVLIAQREMLDDLTSNLKVLYNGTQRLIDSKKTADKVSAQIKDLKGDEIKELQKAVKAVTDSISSVQDKIFGKQNPDAQGITSRQNITVTGKVFEAMRYIDSRPKMPTATEKRLVEQANSLIKDGVDEINSFYKNVWPEFRKKVEETEVSLFKDYKPLELE